MRGAVVRQAVVGGPILHETKLPWKVRVHAAVKELQPRLEAGERITLLIEDARQAGSIRHLLPPSPEMPGFLRIALAAEVGPLSLRRFQDSEVVSIARCPDRPGRGASERVL